MESIYGQVLRSNLESQQSYASPFQGRSLSRDIFVVIPALQRLANFRQGSFELGKLCLEFGCFILVAQITSTQIAAAQVIQIQIDPGDTVLVQIDPVYAPHVHESYASLFPQFLFQGLPIGRHTTDLSLSFIRVVCILIVEGCLGAAVAWPPAFPIADTPGSVLVVTAGVAGVRWRRARADFVSLASCPHSPPSLAFPFQPH